MTEVLVTIILVEAAILGWISLRPAPARRLTNLGRLQVRANTMPNFGAAQTHLWTFLLDERDGSTRPYAFTDNDLRVARERADKNPEDAPGYIRPA